MCKQITNRSAQGIADSFLISHILWLGPRAGIEEAMGKLLRMLLFGTACTIAIAVCIPEEGSIPMRNFRPKPRSEMELLRKGTNGIRIQTSSNLRLRGGGKREIPMDMKMFHWWDTSPWAWVITALCGASFLYILPGLPKITKLNPVLVAEGKIGSVLFVVGSLLLFAAPAIEDLLGWWTLGFAPISETIVLMGVVLIAHAIGETIAEARDQALEDDTIDPYQESFMSNYRWKG